jgi:hypothetical protein
VHQSKKAKKSHSGIHNDWVQRTQDVVPHEDDFGKLGEVQVQTSVQLEVPRDELMVDNTHVRSHSPSSGKSFSSSSRPQSLPGSGDESEGGIADDAGERLSTEHKQLSGKPLHPNVLKSHYSRSRSTTVCLQLGLVTELMSLCLRPGPALGGHHRPNCPHNFRSSFYQTIHKCSTSADAAQKRRHQAQ